MPDRSKNAAMNATSDRTPPVRVARTRHTDPDVGAGEAAADLGSAGAGETAERVEAREPYAGWPPRDILTPFVLLAVSMQRAHGYVIEDYLRALGLFGITMSTLYRTLRQMERDGFLESTWEPGPTGPARRVYTITDTGQAWLQSSATMLDAYRQTIDRFFGLYGAGPGTSRDQPDEPPDDKETEG
jgi:poly-beta-hydroxybutyrate-responsive repressor